MSFNLGAKLGAGATREIGYMNGGKSDFECVRMRYTTIQKFFSISFFYLEMVF